MTGVSQLGYLGFEVSDLDAWARFSEEILGVEARRTSETALELRIDGRAGRFFLHQGPRDDLSALGFEVADGDALEALAHRFTEVGLPFEWGDDTLCRGRRAQRVLRTKDPAGNGLELFCGPESAETPFASALAPGGFVADDLGLGHAAISARSQAESLAFYTQLLGFRLSDRIVCEYYGYPVDMVFLHCNARHHTLAFGEQQPKRIHHFLLEAAEVDDVGKAYDRALSKGVRFMNTLGKHPNDEMFSFYAFTPSGFQFEFGHGGRLVDDADWTPTTYDRISDWGHHPPAAFRGPKR